MVAAQADGCAPIARAFESGAHEVLPWTGPVGTRALAIADRLTGYASQATYALAAIRASGGRVGTATDSEMDRMRRQLALHDGIDVELASAAAAVVLARERRGSVTAVCVLTGAGWKDTLSVDGEPETAGDVETFAEQCGVGLELVREVETWVRASHL